MTSLTTNQNKPPRQLNLSREDYEKLTLTPWFSYRATLPIQPLQSIPERPQIQTARLLVRPLLPTDLAQFHELRREATTQNHSFARGRPDRDVAETRRHLEALQTGERHWYFGAFLRGTGELVGEGGIFDCAVMPRCGWPEAEVLIKSSHWRRGYGTELFGAFMESWWALPRERRRHQLIPIIVADKEPGDDVVDGINFSWEQGNVAATAFFAKVLGQYPVSVEGALDEFDQRDGREGNLVKWVGTLTVNPKPHANLRDS